MIERIIINDFGGIKNLEIEVNKINILIGPQAVGKSICAKLLYFFKSFWNEIYSYVFISKSNINLNDFIIDKFKKFFPPETYSENDFYLKYILNENYIEIIRKKEKIELSYSEKYQNFLHFFQEKYKNPKEKFLSENFSLNDNRELLKQKIGEITNYSQKFIPSGRSFFTNFERNIFSFLAKDLDIDRFLIEFGYFFEESRYLYDRLIKIISSDVNKIISEIIGGDYLQEKDGDYIIHNDGRKIKLSLTSSGQQEILPLLLILSIFSTKKLIDGYTIYKIGRASCRERV